MVRRRQSAWFIRRMKKFIANFKIYHLVQKENKTKKQCNMLLSATFLEINKTNLNLYAMLSQIQYTLTVLSEFKFLP